MFRRYLALGRLHQNWASSEVEGTAVEMMRELLVCVDGVRSLVQELEGIL